MSACAHSWVSMAGGYRYECSACRVVGIRHADGVVRPYSDGGRMLRQQQKKEALDALEWRWNEERRAREEREGRMTARGERKPTPDLFGPARYQDTSRAPNGITECIRQYGEDSKVVALLRIQKAYRTLHPPAPGGCPMFHISTSLTSGVVLVGLCTRPEGHDAAGHNRGHRVLVLSRRDSAMIVERAKLAVEKAGANLPS